MAAEVKLYNSKRWMERQYRVHGLKPEQIAEKAGCSTITVYRKLREFGIIS
jgi:transcriptional regulator of acetoin/glycerol metabolism